MEDSDGPGKGGSKQEISTETEAEWRKVISKSVARNSSGKGSGKGGKGSGKDGKGGPQVIWAQPQGDRRVFPDAEFNKNEIYPKPVILMTAEKFPVPAYDMNDKDKLHELRMESHASFLRLHKILRDFHGDLDSARKPLPGEIISVQLRFENYGTLFDGNCKSLICE